MDPPMNAEVAFPAFFLTGKLPKDDPIPFVTLLLCCHEINIILPVDMRKLLWSHCTSMIKNDLDKLPKISHGGKDLLVVAESLGDIIYVEALTDHSYVSFNDCKMEIINPDNINAINSTINTVRTEIDLKNEHIYRMIFTYALPFVALKFIGCRIVSSWSFKDRDHYLLSYDSHNISASLNSTLNDRILLNYTSGLCFSGLKATRLRYSYCIDRKYNTNVFFANRKDNEIDRRDQFRIAFNRAIDDGFLSYTCGKVAVDPLQFIDQSGNICYTNHLNHMDLCTNTEPMHW